MFLIYFCTAYFLVIPVGSFYYDEGWAANIGYHIANGKTLYKDISAPYGPVVFHIYAFLITLFGKNFFVFRIAGILIIILQSYFSARIVSFFTKNKAIIIFTAFISLLPLGFYQSGRITASSTAGLLTLMIAFTHLSYLRKRNRIYIAVTGVLLALLLLTKHNVFGLDLAANGILMLLVSISMYKKEGKIDYQYFLLPFLSFFTILLPYIASVLPYITDLLNDTVSSISQYGSSDMTIPYPMPFDLIEMSLGELRSALFLYSIVPLTLAAGLIFYKLIKENNEFDLGIIFITLLSIFHYIEIYPLSDYSHYGRATIIYAPYIGILLYLTHKQQNTKALYLLTLTLFLHLYQSPTFLITNIKTVITKPVSSLSYLKHIRKLPEEDQILKIIDEIRTAKGSKIMIIGHASVYYYLSDNISGSRFNTITHHYLNNLDQRKVIQEIKTNEIDYLIEAPSVRTQKELDELDILGSYVRNNFSYKKEVDEFGFWYKTTD